MNKDIIVLDKDLYLVHGKVIRGNTPGMFETEQGRKDLVDIVDRFLESPYACVDPGCPGVYGFHALENDPDGARQDFSTQEPMASLPDSVKDAIRKEAPELGKWL